MHKSLFSNCNVRVSRLFFTVWIGDFYSLIVDIRHFSLRLVRQIFLVSISRVELAELVEAQILHLEAPLDSCECIVSQRWRQQLEIGFGAEDFEQVIPHSLEGEVVMIGLVACVPADELDGRETAAGEEPAPQIVDEEADGQEGIENYEVAHHLPVLLV